MREGIGKSDIEGKDWFNVFDEVSEIVTMKDADLRYLWANRSFENLYKLSLKEIVGKTDAELFSPEIAEWKTNADHSTLKLGRQTISGSFDLSGKIVHVESMIEVVRNGAGLLIGLLEVMRDITEIEGLRRKVEALKLRQSSENNLMQIGRLIPGIAHNISNPLTIVSARAQFMKMKHPELTDPDIIVEQVKKIESILMNLTKKSQEEQNPEIRLLNLNEILKGEIYLLEADSFFKHRVIKKINLAEDLSSVNGVYGDFSEIFSSIISFVLQSDGESEKRSLSIQTTHENVDNIVEISGLPGKINAGDLSKYLTSPNKMINNMIVDIDEFLLTRLYGAHQKSRKYEIVWDISDQTDLTMCFRLKIPFRLAWKKN
jgi:PAS domain S-box-containing protein